MNYLETYSVITFSEEETKDIGKKIGCQLRGGEVIVLSGRLGVGKTVFVKGIATGMGISKKIKSPSFVLEKIYPGKLTLYHYDFYRLSKQEVLEAGLLNEMDDTSVAVIEWGEKVEPEVWDLKISMDFVPGMPESRDIKITVNEDSWREKMAHVFERSGPE